jgi:dTDP-4-dehydrorhamnose 3,5-epimerase
MKIQPSAIPEVKLIHLDCHQDDRGMLVETYDSKVFAHHGINPMFVQDFLSRSTKYGTIRGLHFQTTPIAQAKLIRVTRGKAFDVVVDLRHGSETFGENVSFILDEADWTQLFIPVGFAHGFCTLSEDMEMAYKASGHYSPEHAMGIKWDDPDLNIDWPIDAHDATVSERDLIHPSFKETAPFYNLLPDTKISS